MIDFGNIPFIQARWFTPTNGREVRKIVLHSAEDPEKPGAARAIAHYLATLDRKASTHYVVDDREIIQCCQTKDVAYGAPGANHDGVHIELAGYARQTAEEWADDYSKAMLQLAAELVARVLVPKFEIPILYLSAPMMAAHLDARGITTHRQVSLAFRRSTHTDPGPAFPVGDFLALVRAAR